MDWHLIQSPCGKYLAELQVVISFYNPKGDKAGVSSLPCLVRAGYGIVGGGTEGIQWGSWDLCRSSIVDKIGLYDLILFLQDPGPSLSEALQILDGFAALSGLNTNWGKSLVLPIDQEAKRLADPNFPLQWATTIKYLEIIISSNTRDFRQLNLSPAFQWWKQRLKPWSHLLLSLIVRITLIMKKILPVLLYSLRHSPVWLPKLFFKPLDSLIGSFLWQSRPARFSRKFLCRPWAQRGLACPDLYTYLFGSHAHLC